MPENKPNVPKNTWQCCNVICRIVETQKMNLGQILSDYEAQFLRHGSSCEMNLRINIRSANY
jgi:hypothetical protein